MEKENNLTHLAYTKESIERILNLLSSIPFTGYDSLRAINEVFYLVTNADYPIIKEENDKEKVND